ncbi:shieldin complex subunit 2 [Betta splendens]|uniref:Shieldin complex subunit 2 n=1 Tax=Betta splendens TaxID=158456 RepID=A0A6P7KNY6_BETSP|nr:shieldin complex subunit 2 [Betta splendens]XP_028983205.1 shieldin complex subunit 2 [Betta splendens]XP_055358658.1 shieldin complex subunit 2 [Betta splendens]
MCDRPKVHVFLGAPPLGTGVEDEERPQSAWRHLGLTWVDGHLKPTTGEEKANQRAQTLLRQQGPTNANLDNSCSERDQTSEKPGKHEQGRSEAEFNAEGEGLCSDDHSAAGRFLSQDKESDPEHEDQCPAFLHEYLDSCFHATQPERDPEHQQSPIICPPSSHTQYLTTWTLSQTLVLRSRHGNQSATCPKDPPLAQPPPEHTQTPPSISSSTPELFSPLTLSPEASAELCSQPCLTPRVKEEGIILQATTDGVLCSQEYMTTVNTPTGSPSVKRARFTEESGLKVNKVQPSRVTSNTGLQGPTTLLKLCDKHEARYSVLVAVVHPCHLKEVKVKSGPSSGTFVPLASVVVTDQSTVEMKVVLWRQAAFWALTVSPGDVLLITGLQVTEDRWRGETVLQSTFRSKLLSLGPAATTLSPQAHLQVNPQALSSLCGFLRERRPLLVSLSCRPHQDLSRLPYASMRSLRPNMLVNAWLRVTHAHMSRAWRSEAGSGCRSVVQLHAVLSVEQVDGAEGTLVLWGAAVDWLQRFKGHRVAVWEFRVLLVREGLTSDFLELHSTPWSSVQPLDPCDPRAPELNTPRPIQTRTSSSSLELDLDTLLSQKYSGEVELRAQVNSFHFQDSPPSQDAAQPVLDGSTPLAAILEALSGDVTYTGCGRCGSELDTDTNGIYSPCYPCLPHTGVRRYYRPGVMSVSGPGSRQVSVQVPPVPLQKILDAPPDKLYRRSAPDSEVKHIQVAAERIQNLVSLPRRTFLISVRSHFLCDENSIPISQDFTLLDLHFPN